MHVYPNYYKKKFIVFSSQSIRMSRNNINFNDKEIEKSNFYKKIKTYLIQTISMLIKCQSLNKNNMANIIHLNTLLGIMIMMLLDHYIQSYFIGYNDNDVIRPLYLEFSQMNGYINEFNEKKK